MNRLIVFQALQGIGGSSLYSLAFLILQQISSLKMLKTIGVLAGAVITRTGKTLIHVHGAHFVGSDC